MVKEGKNNMSELVVKDTRASSDADLPAAAAPRGSTPMEMLAAAISRNMPVETLDKLLSLQERWEKNEARKAFDAAMSALRADLPEIIKSKKVGYDHKDGGGKTEYVHETLDAVTAALSPAMAKHGLAFRWRIDDSQAGRVRVTCVVSHAQGYFEETSLSAAPDASGKKNAIQQIGSAITYLQRYTLKAAVGVAAAHDDDARTNEAPDFDVEPWLDRIDAAFDAKDKKAAAAIRDELMAEVKAGSVPKHAQDILQGHFAERLAAAKREAATPPPKEAAP